MSIEQRIEKAERTLSLDREPLVLNIVYFADGPLPPEERRGNIIIRHVPYRDERKQAKDGEA